MPPVPTDAEKQLLAYAGRPDLGTDLADTVLLLSDLDKQPLDRWEAQARLDTINKSVARLGLPEDSQQAADHLTRVIREKEGFEGDRRGFDDSRSLNLLSVLLRRSGHPVVLGLLYIIVARAQGWQARGIGSAPQFMVEVAVDGTPVLLDPFLGDSPVSQVSVSSLWEDIAGLRVGQSSLPMYYHDDRGVLLLLLDVQKRAALANRRIDQAVEMVRRMTLLAPDLYAPWLELGLLRWETGELHGARDALSVCRGVVVNPVLQRVISAEIDDITGQLN